MKLKGRQIFNCIDAHTCGNPVRVVTSGKPQLKGNTMAERRQYFLEHYDWIRTGLVLLQLADTAIPAASSQSERIFGIAPTMM